MSTTVELAPEQAQALAEISEREKRSVEALVSEAIAALLATAQSSEAEIASARNAGLREGFGAWRGLVEEDGLEMQRRLRAEWPD